MPKRPLRGRGVWSNVIKPMLMLHSKRISRTSQAITPTLAMLIPGAGTAAQIVANPLAAGIGALYMYDSRPRQKAVNVIQPQSAPPPDYDHLDPPMYAPGRKRKRRRTQLRK